MPNFRKMVLLAVVLLLLLLTFLTLSSYTYASNEVGSGVKPQAGAYTFKVYIPKVRKGFDGW